MCASRTWRFALTSVLAALLFGVAERAAFERTAEATPVPTPVLDAAHVVDTDPLTLEVTGTLFGDIKGRVKIGRRRARVKAWTDTSVTVRVPRRLRGGMHAIEMVPRTGAASPVPLPYFVERTYGNEDRMRFRRGSSSGRFVKGDARRMSAYDVCIIQHWRTRIRWVEVRKRVERCQRIWHWTPFPGHFTRRCHSEWATVPEKRKSRSEVRLRLPYEVMDKGFVGVITSDDWQPDSPPILFEWPKRSQSVDSGASDWWIVIGCDEDGVVTGQFSGWSTGTRKRLQGSFVVHP